MYEEDDDINIEKLIIKCKEMEEKLCTKVKDNINSTKLFIKGKYYNTENLE